MSQHSFRDTHAVCTERFAIELPSPDELVIALAGNPNTGKSTVFNALTGMNQHTGNWAGKTVGSAIGRFRHQEHSFTLVDLPGTYSLLSQSADEQVARDFICFANPHATLVVTDATNLERNLNLALQVMEVTDRVVVAVNLMDEAKRKGITIDFVKLQAELGVPVIPMTARSGEGLNELKEMLWKVALGHVTPTPKLTTYSEQVERAVTALLPQVEPLVSGVLRSRWVALRLLDGDESVLQALEQYTLEHPRLFSTGDVVIPS
ncbi:iron transporter FeoB [Tumebacillus algifaecis]|uniref:Iron transporter FeoB n=1 Tax=Tumebacillus algifaecis TaxID=1214604 RepID=A0A223D4A7_9BACL|nr:FeoB small GTPase domain-containing protein [Tumebacillus algifaecis]ASS76422.1 iron transporter FeoB [Tumebacillus algifaecis]